jgi:hypothetical protein
LPTVANRLPAESPRFTQPCWETHFDDLLGLSAQPRLHGRQLEEEHFFNGQEERAFIAGSSFIARIVHEIRTVAAVASAIPNVVRFSAAWAAVRCGLAILTTTHFARYFLLCDVIPFL